MKKKKEKERISNTIPPTLYFKKILDEMKKKWIQEGLITESFFNGIRLDNEDLVLDYVSGRIRRDFALYVYHQKIESKWK